MLAMELYDLVRDGKISVVEFMRKLDAIENKAWNRGYDKGFENAKIVFAPIEVASVQ